MTGARWTTWRKATERALYGPGGFYVRGTGPAAHFRTSVHASRLFAVAVHRLATETRLTTVVDVGSGGGELLAALHTLDPTLRLCGVDIASRPAGLPSTVDWVHDLAELAGTSDVLLVANEWLDDVPVDVVTRRRDGLRLVEVDTTGRERLGPSPTSRDVRWIDRWWPLAQHGDRAEVGHPRDDAWAAAVRAVRRGLLVAADYAHDLTGRPPGGSLTGYRAGRVVPPVPDGSCDVTSHVALDACAAAGTAAGAAATLLLSQREALQALGVDASLAVPSRSAARPALEVLAARGAAAELLEPGGLGGFTWLVQTVGLPVPGVLAAAGQPRTGTDE
jgi:SAM-dependent MidA family methyltransferase